MNRRGFLAGAAAAAVRPALAQPAITGASKTLIFVPISNPPSWDPVWSTAQATRTLGLMVYETLYTRDTSLNPHPHMVDGHVVEDDGRRWTMTLRAGQTFHDGTPVLARDCVASIRRWMVRDPLGASIKARLDALEAPDDRTIVWRLNKPFPFLPNALAKTQPTCAIMPERLASGDPFKQVPEPIGSGPLRWVPDQFVSGSRAMFAKHDRYVPRPEKVEYAWGGYHVKVDRVEWRIISDAATAASALRQGEVDWVEIPSPDLLPSLRSAPGVTVGRLDTHGIMQILRPNFVMGPTTNLGIRRAMLAAVDQVDMMTAVMGDDREGWEAPVGFFVPGSPAGTDAGMDAVRKRPGIPAIKAMLAEAGYKGERIVLMNPADLPAYSATCLVADAAFRAVGLNIDLQTTDWGTVTERRASKEPLDKGGWSLFPSGLPATDHASPVLTTALRSNGKSAWFGWPDDPKLEALRDAWIDAPDTAEQRRLAGDIQAEAFAYLPYIPVGHYIQSTAWRNTLSGLLRGPAPVFWNVEKA